MPVLREDLIGLSKRGKVISTLGWEGSAGFQSVVNGSMNSGASVGTTPRLMPVTVSEPFVLSTISWLNGTTATGNLDVGVYDMFGNRIASSGPVALAGTSQPQTATLTPTLLDPDNYYAACTASSTALLTAYSAALINSGMVELHGVAAASATATTLPSTLSFSRDFAQALIFLLLLSEA